jgi:hypothetical protein
MDIVIYTLMSNIKTLKKFVVHLTVCMMTYG